MEPVLKILFCDDDNSFAQTQVKNLQRKLKIRHGIDSKQCFIKSFTQLKKLREMSRSEKESSQWDLIFCDLGWGDLTLEGIQILNDMQMSHPRIFSVLYTAQDEDEIIKQAMEWQLHFVDVIIRIDGPDYFEKMLHLIYEKWKQKQNRESLVADVQSEKNISFFGERVLSQKFNEGNLNALKDDLLTLQEKLSKNFFAKEPVALECLISESHIELKWREDPLALKQKRYDDLIAILQRFPQIEGHELVALDKPAYIQFIKKKYGGFPQMASARGLDLNNIYRVNRRFKNAPFIVFKFETIQEILGVYDQNESQKLIQNLLATPQKITGSL